MAAKPKTLAQTVAAENNKFRKQIYAEHLEANVQHNKGRTDDIDEFRNTAYQQALKDAKVVEGKAQLAATTEPEPEKRGPGRPKKNP